jgi:hypothetical protein
MTCPEATMKALRYTPLVALGTLIGLRLTDTGPLRRRPVSIDAER